MRRLLAVAEVSLRKTWRERTFLLIMMATAIGFSALYGVLFGGITSGGGGKIAVVVSDNDNSTLSGQMIADLENSGSYSVTAASEESVYEDVRQGEVEAGFVIPAGFQNALSFGTPLPVSVVSLPSSNTGMAAGAIMEKSITAYLLDRAVVSVVSAKAEELGVFERIDAEAAVAVAREQLSQSQALSVTFEPVTQEAASDDTQKWSASFSAGVYVMFSMFTVVFNAGDILKERRAGTWARLLASPATKWQVVGGKMAGSYGVGLIQVVTLLLIGRYVLKVDFGPHFGSVVAIMALMVAVSTALGLFLSSLVKTSAQLQSTAPLIVVATSMLGGCYWPLEVVSPTMQTIAKLTPQAWAMTAITDVAVRGYTLAATSQNLVVLACFGIVLLTLGTVFTKYE